jgi:hypothetical protein
MTCSGAELQSVTNHFVHLQPNRLPAPPFQCSVWKYLPKMFLASDPTLFRVREGVTVFYAEQYLEMRRYVYIISLSKNLLSLIVAPFNSGESARINCPAKTDDALQQIFISGPYFSQKCRRAVVNVVKKCFPYKFLLKHGWNPYFWTNICKISVYKSYSLPSESSVSYLITLHSIT